MNHIYYFSNDERKSDGLTVKNAIETTEHADRYTRYAKSVGEFWDGKMLQYRAKRAYRNIATSR